MHGRRTIAAVALIAGAMALLPGSASASHFGKRTLKYGSSGSDVRVLQDFLTRIGVPTAVDGQFGRGTRRSVRRWERAIDIKRNGKVSRRNARRLTRMVKRNRRVSTAPKPKTREAAVEKATLAPDGTAIAPESAPRPVKDMIAAANEIHDKPYKYGGGHGRRVKDSGYDCSGSMSYVLRKTGYLDHALDSTGFMSYGKKGRGQWVTTYAHGGHAYMVIAGLRFDTSGRAARGSRWTDEMRSSKGFTVRHVPGL